MNTQTVNPLFVRVHQAYADRECEHCQKLYTPKTYAQRVCSARCRKLFRHPRPPRPPQISPRTYLVLELYCDKGMRQRDIVLQLGMSRSRVSQIVRKYADDRPLPPAKVA